MTCLILIMFDFNGYLTYCMNDGLPIQNRQKSVVDSQLRILLLFTGQQVNTQLIVIACITGLLLLTGVLMYVYKISKYDRSPWASSQKSDILTNRAFESRAKECLVT